MASRADVFGELVWPIIAPEVAPGASIVVDGTRVNQLNKERLGTKDVKGAVRAWVDDPAWDFIPLKWAVQWAKPDRKVYETFTVREGERISEDNYEEAEYYPLKRCLQAGLLPDMVTVRAAVMQEGDEVGTVLEVALCRTAVLVDSCGPKYNSSAKPAALTPGMFVNTNRGDGNHFFSVPFTKLPGMKLWRRNGTGELERCEHLYQPPLFE